ncbi:MAG: NAD(P)-dependent oxidoreductase, partial [Acidimicrobiia bacterium]
MGRRSAPWVTALAEASDRFEAVDVPGADPERVRVLVVAGPPTEPLPDWPHLGLVQSLWHGVDALVDHPLLPPDVPIARLVDPGVPAAMARFVTRIVLDRSQRVDEYAELAARAEWRPLAHLTPSDVTVGVLGLGEVGRAVAALVGGLGHPVIGWRSRPEPVAGVEVVTGPAGLASLVGRADVLVNTLPSTPGTQGLLTAELLGRLPERAAFVNVGRGDVVAEPDLVAG